MAFSPFLLAGVLLLCPRSILADALLLLPLANESEGDNYNWISECVPISVGSLLEDNGMMVVRREQRLMAYERHGISPAMPLSLAGAIKLGQTLDARWVGVGAFRVEEVGEAKAGARQLLVTLKIIDLSELRPELELEDSGPLESILSVQQQLAQRLFRKLSAAGQKEPEAFQAGNRSVRLDALESYFRALTAGSEEERRRLLALSARLDPSYGEPRYQLGKLHFAKKDYRLASEWLAGVPKGTHGYREAEFLLGISLYNIGQFQRALEALGQVEQEVPVNEVVNNLAVVESRLGIPGAEEKFRLLVERDPSNPVFRFNLGYVLWQKERFAEAAAEFQEILKMNPQDADAQLLYERCGKRMGPKPRDLKSKGLERMLETFPERAYQELVNLLKSPKQ